MFGKINNSSGEVLDYTFHAGTEGSRHIAVLGHGVTGNKDRPFVVALAEGLAAAGIHALRFSFAGNGASEGRFADATISKEVEDLGAVLGTLDGYSVCYVGHSMGGAVGVLRASRDERIRCSSPWRAWCIRTPLPSASSARRCPTRAACGKSQTVRSRKPTWTTWLRSTPWCDAEPRL